MKVKCPGCGAVLNVNENKIPATGATAKCPKCGGPIRLIKPGNTPPRSPDHLFRCPKCGLVQEKGTECRSCGVVFSKIASPPGPDSQPAGPAPFRPDNGQPPTHPEAGAIPLPVPTRMLPAVLVTIFCCLPAGVAALIFAGRVRKYEANGDYEGARQASRTVGIFCLISLIMGLVLVAAVGWYSLRSISDQSALSEDESGESEKAPAADDRKSDGALPDYLRHLKKAKTSAETQAVRAALHNLKAAQETYYAERGTFAPNLDALAGIWLPNERVEVEILSADYRSWSARARYKGTSDWITFDSNRD